MSASTLLDIADEPWRVRAACRGADPSMFDEGAPVEQHMEALGYCRQCPVTGQCAAWARREYKFLGVAGGRVWRRTYRKRRKRTEL